jgi:undecaprenyl diphosphate synthase
VSGARAETASAEQLLEAVRAGGGAPGHVAVIMDGNGRWAHEHGLPRWEGHREGMSAVRETVEGGLEVGLAHLTLYAFSSENWSRPREEIEALMDLLREFVDSEKEELRRHGVRVQVFGELERLSKSARAAVDDLQSHTCAADRMELHLAISYGARQEITAAARSLARRAVRGELKPEEIDEERFSSELYTAGWPDPDLLIRTSGEMRISNFLLWQIAYAELHVTEVLWPDFDRSELYRGILEFQRRERRFGRV